MKRTVLSLIAILVLARSAHAGDDAAKQSIAYVQKLQTDGGGFMPQADGKPSLRATSAAVRALHYLGGALKDKDACVKFVGSCYDADSGGFSDVPKGKPGVFETAVGLMAVAELKMPLEKYSDGASKYLTANAQTFEEIRIAAAGFEAIKKKSPKQKAWVAETLAIELLDEKPPNARTTASVVVTLLRLDHKLGAPEASIKIIKAGQRQAGGWGKEPTTADAAFEADLESSYRVMRCFVMLKARPDNVEAVRSFVAKCRNADGGYGVAPGQPSSVGGTYFASIITHWLKEMP